MPTGPRPMMPAEREAFTLHALRVPVESIEEQTGLTRPQIAAAVDLGRLHAQAVLQKDLANPAPATTPQPVRVRQASLQRLPGATIPPSPKLPTPTELLPARPTPAAAPAPRAAPEPDLERLARSREVRAWAAANGWTIPPGPRLPGAIIHAYLNAHGGNP